MAATVDRRMQIALAALIAAAAALYLLNLSATGYGNLFYAAAAEWVQIPNSGQPGDELGATRMTTVIRWEPIVAGAIEVVVSILATAVYLSRGTAPSPILRWSASSTSTAPPPVTSSGASSRAP